MKLSILIVNWNTKDLVLSCIHSIFDNVPSLDFEVVVVDNASSDGSYVALQEHFAGNKQVKIIASQENLGFGRGNNLAYEESTGEYIFLLNPDCLIRPGTLDTLVTYMDAHDDVGIVGPKIIYPDGRPQASVRTFPGLWASVLVFSGLHRLFRLKKYFMLDFDYSREGSVDQVMGAGLFTKRKIIEQLGFFDENFWLWYEEVDFCKRVKVSGWKIMYCPTAVIEHYSGKSFSQLSPLARKKIVAKSLLYYFQKHGTKFDLVILNLAVPVVLAITLVLEGLMKIFHFKVNPHV